MPNVGQELLNVPFAEMVQKLALGIAEGQTKLDQNSAEVAKLLSSTIIQLPQIDDPSKAEDFSLMALGFFPGFYQFTEAIIEVKMAISFQQSRETNASVSAKGGWGPVSASVNASYSSKYSYSVEGSSLLRVKMAPAPPPAVLLSYMEAVIKKASDAVEEKVNPTE